MRNTLILYLLLTLLIGNIAFANGGKDTTRFSKKLEKFILLPAIIKSPETKWGFGAATSIFFKSRKRDSTIRTSNVETIGLYTLNKQLLIALGSNVYFPRERYIFKSHNSFSSFPDKFWGLGNHSTRDHKESYRFQQYYMLHQLQRKFYKSFFAGPQYDYQNVFTFDYEKQGIFDKENVEGRHGGHVSGLGFTLAWDNRNNAFSPSKGSFIQFSYLNFNKIIKSQYNFVVYNIDLRKFIQIRRGHVIAMQAYGNFASGSAPIRNLSALGGANVMRGYYQGRYRDKDLVAVQSEYRVHIWKRLGAVIFGGLGEVGPAIKQIALKGLKYSFGGGVRIALKEKEKLNLRLDYGFGNHSSGAYLIVTEAF